MNFFGLALCLLQLSSCSGTSRGPQQPVLQSAMGQPPSALPVPLDVERGKSSVTELRIRGGADLLPGQEQNVVASGSSGIFTVDPAGDPPEPGELAFAVYSFSIAAETSVPKLSPKWDAALQPADGAVFLALANWQLNRWQWQQIDPGGSFEIPDAAPYRRADGTVLAVVLLAQSTSGKLEWIRLGGNTPPSISAVITGDGLVAPQTIAVDATASNDFDGSIATFSWDWNADGSVEAQDALPGTAERFHYLGGSSHLLLRAVDDEGLSSELLLEFELLPHSSWWCPGANRYQNRRSPATAPSLLTAEDAAAWSFDVGDGPLGVLVGTDGTLYAGSITGQVFAIDPLTGQEITHFDEGPGIYMRLRAIGPDGSVYVLIDNGEPETTNVVLSLDADLQENWRITGSQGARDIHGFTLEGGVLVSYAANELRSLDPQTLVQNWQLTMDEQPVGMASTGDDGTVYIGGFWSTAYGIRPDGSLRSTYWMRATIYNAPMLDSQGKLVFVTDNSNVTRFDPDGDELFNFNLPSSNNILSIPAIGFVLGDERILFSSEGRSLHSLKLDGTEGWTINEASRASSICVDAQEDILCIYGGGLGSYKPNKNPNWQFDFDPPLTGLNLLAILPDGSLLVSSFGSHTIYCYRP